MGRWPWESAVFLSQQVTMESGPFKSCAFQSPPPTEKSRRVSEQFLHLHSTVSVPSGTRIPSLGDWKHPPHVRATTVSAQVAGLGVPKSFTFNGAECAQSVMYSGVRYPTLTGTYLTLRRAREAGR